MSKTITSIILLIVGYILITYNQVYLVVTGGFLLLFTYIYVILMIESTELSKKYFHGDLSLKSNLNLNVRALLVAIAIVAGLAPVLFIFIILWRIYSILEMGIPPLGVIGITLIITSGLMLILMSYRKHAKKVNKLENS